MCSEACINAFFDAVLDFFITSKDFHDNRSMVQFNSSLTHLCNLCHYLQDLQNFSWLPSYVLHRGSQYTTHEEHNLTRYMHVIFMIIHYYVTCETFSKSGVMSIKIEKILLINLWCKQVQVDHSYYHFSPVFLLLLIGFLCILHLERSWLLLEVSLSWNFCSK